jgi:dipeptidyl aminopeptidase/acylaminoacyl peptidase
MRHALIRFLASGLVAAGGAVGYAVAATAQHPAAAARASTPGDSPVLSAEQLLAFSSVVSARNEPAWSPDGSEITYVGSYGGPSGLWAVRSGGGQPRLLVRSLPLAGFGFAPSPIWSPKGDFVAYVSTKGGDAPEIWLWSPHTGRDVQLTRMGGAIYSMSWSPDGTRIAFSDDRYGSQDIYTVEVPDGEVLRLTSDPLYEVFPTWTPDGRSILYDRLDERWVSHDLMILPADGSAPPRVVVTEPELFDYRGGDLFGYSPVSPDGKMVLFRSQRSGWLNYWVVPLAGGTPRPLNAEAAEQSDGSWSPNGKWVAYVSNHNGTKGLYVIATNGGAPRRVRALVAPTEGVVSRVAWSPYGTHLSYLFGTTTTPVDLYSVDVETALAAQLTFSGPTGETRSALITPRKVTYPSADGFTISAYLYEPTGLKPGERAPGIMYIHGGPTGQFVDSYLPQVQYFASRGYAVLLPNIRGSSGYGRAFEDANNGCWGHCDLKDVLAGVDYLKRQPYVNAEKMGITGISYGGCMTMSAIAFAPGVFQAAIPESGYGDWVRFREWNNELQHNQLLAFEFGPLPDSDAVYRRNSPIYSVAQVTTPTFLIHGEGATTAWRPAQLPVSASLDFARALDAHYKVFRYKAYPGETYYITSPENIRVKLGDMLAFFDQYLKDGLRSAPSAVEEPAPVAVSRAGSTP